MFSRVVRGFVAVIVGAVGIVVVAANPAAAAPGTVTMTAETASGDEDALGDVTFTVTYTGTGPAEVTIGVVGTSTATVDDDFSGVPVTPLIFPTGGVQTFDIAVDPDTHAEPDETFTLEIASIDDGSTIVGVAPSVDIVNDDGDVPAISVSLPSTARTESLPGVFDLSISPAPTQDVTVVFDTSDGTAIDADDAPRLKDYDAVSTTVTFTAGGATTIPVPVTVVNDTIDEDNETFTGTISAPTNAVLGTTTAVEYTILDNDASPTVTLTGGSFDEDDGIGGDGTATITATLSARTERDVSVDYVLTGDTATAGDDFDATGGTLSIGAAEGITETSADIVLVDDAIDEDDETFTATAITPSNLTISGDPATVTITDGDDAPTLSLADATVTEGDDGTVDLEFDLALTGATEKTVTVTARTLLTGTATVDDDFTDTTTPIVFGPEGTYTFTVPVVGDLIHELDETVDIELVDLVNATQLDDAADTDATAIGTITDDDLIPAVTVDDIEITEVDDGATSTGDLTLTLSAPSGRTTNVRVQGTGTTATVVDDFDAIDSTVAFAPGETEKTVTVTVNGDLLSEDDETIAISLSTTDDPATVDTTDTATVTIIDDDPEETLSIDDVSDLESAGQFLFTVTLSGVTGRDIDVDAATVVGTAGADDFVAASETVTIPAGDLTATFAVTITDDSFAEVDETFTVVLTNPVGATITDEEGLGTIENDDGTPVVVEELPDVAVGEADGTATLTVTLSSAPTAGVLIDYTTVAGTATETDDFVAKTGTLTIPALSTTGDIVIDIVGDDRDDADTERFDIVLSNFRNAAPPASGDVTSEVTITDDDDPPTVNAGDGTAPETSADSTSPITLSHASDNQIVVMLGRSGTAVNCNFAGHGDCPDDSDYSGILFIYSSVEPPPESVDAEDVGGGFWHVKNAVIFEPGETTHDLTLRVYEDTTFEDDETIIITPVTDDTATAGTAGTVTIPNTDDPPLVSIDDVEIDEGDAGTVEATFTVTLSEFSAKTGGVDVTAGDGTAVAPDDFTAKTETLTFAPGEVEKTFTVEVAGDLLDEIDETFAATLGAESDLTIDDGDGVGTILDDDDPPVVSITSVTYDPEGDTEPTAMNFIVSLDAPSGQSVSVDVGTVDGTAIAADGDYDEIAPTTITFDPGDVSLVFPVTVNGDLLDELDETFTVALTNPVNATTGDAGTGTIVDDDDPPVVSIALTATAVEGDDATTDVSIDISLDAPSGQTVEVDYATGPGEAETDVDFEETTGTATFAPGETVQSVDIAVIGDETDEIDETFTVALSNPVLATIDPEADTSTVTITDDDDPPTLSVSDTSVVEGDTGTVDATVEVTLSAPSSLTVTVDATTTAGTATAVDDYTEALVALSFAPGETSKTVTVAVVGDEIDEGASEAFTIDLANEVNATILDGSGTVTIIDDEGAPNILIDDTEVREGDTEGNTASFRVYLTNPSADTVTVDVSTSGGTATPVDDYTPVVTTTLTFDPGDTEQFLDVDTVGDSTEEPDETFNVDLADPTNATIADAQGVGTIVDDDGIRVTIADNLTITEGASGQSDAEFTVTLSEAAADTITVTFETQTGTSTTEAFAAAPSDFITTSGTVTFDVGDTEATAIVPIVGDTVDELDEGFLVVLTGATGAFIDDAEADALIIDDDSAPVFTIDDVSVTEGTGSDTTATFTVTLTGASDRAATVSVATANGSATAGSDYTAVPATTLTFAPGDTSRAVAVTVLGDSATESSETYTVGLSGAVNATIGDASGLGTIIDDDNLPMKWYIRNTATTGIANATFEFGRPTDVALACDWNGNGRDTPGLFRNGIWLLNNGLDSTAEIVFVFGTEGDIPLCGDWDGNGIDSIGFYRRSNRSFYLRNTNSSGPENARVVYGRRGDLPVVGDWDGNGTTTLGVFRGNVTYLRNSNSGGPADLSFGYGKGTDVKVVGDWDGNGSDTFAVRRNNSYYVRNSNSTGVADFVFAYGKNTDKPIAGDWAGRGRSGMGIIRPR